MAELSVRRLLIDLETPPARHWCGGDAFRSAWFNALSMSFPSGEQFFIDALRTGVAAMTADDRAHFEPAIKGFIGQEATHRRIHALFNGHLAAQGLRNHWETRALQRVRQFEGADPRAAIGATAAAEHLTAILAEHLLADRNALDGADARWATMWLWHASEEIEHRAIAFDAYRTLGGNEKWRLRLFRAVSFYFVADMLRQTINNLWHDGSLWRWSTWRSGWRFLFARGGQFRALAGPWRRYLRADFHPLQDDGTRGLAWLQANTAQFEVVGRAPTGVPA